MQKELTEENDFLTWLRQHQGKRGRIGWLADKLGSQDNCPETIDLWEDLRFYFARVLDLSDKEYKDAMYVYGRWIYHKAKYRVFYPRRKYIRRREW